MKNTESLSKETRSVIKNPENLKNHQMEILELKNAITKAKSTMDGPISRTERREQRISELKDETTGITQYEPKIANRLKGGKKDKIASETPSRLFSSVQFSCSVMSDSSRPH